MKDRSYPNGILQKNKLIEALFLSVGLLLFVLLGVRGIQNIDNMAVAAGEAHRNSYVQDSDLHDRFDTTMVMAGTMYLETEPESVHFPAQNSENTQLDDKSVNKRQNSTLESENNDKKTKFKSSSMH